MYSITKSFSFAAVQRIIFRQPFKNLALGCPIAPLNVTGAGERVGFARED
jgi:hypothetical protein